jgi:glycosyltransferase involved in cell wall biosynthesis
MNILGIAVVRDEDDLICEWVDHHESLLDGLIVIDDGSTDRTVPLLGMMRDYGAPLRLYRKESSALHSAAMTAAMHENGADWYVFLDADEFLDCSRSQLWAHLAAVPPDHCASFAWQTYVPIDGQFYRRKPEGREYVKCAVPADLAPHVEIVPLVGAHQIRYRADKELVKLHRTDVPLAHFPVRSSEQMTKKCRAWADYYANNPKAGKSPQAYAQWLADNPHGFSAEALRKLALRYGIGDDAPTETEEEATGLLEVT